MNRKRPRLVVLVEITTEIDPAHVTDGKQIRANENPDIGGNNYFMPDGES